MDTTTLGTPEENLKTAHELLCRSYRLMCDYVPFQTCQYLLDDIEAAVGLTADQIFGE